MDVLRGNEFVLAAICIIAQAALGLAGCWIERHWEQINFWLAWLDDLTTNRQARLDYVMIAVMALDEQNKRRPS